MWDLYSKIVRHWWEKLKSTQRNGKLFNAHGLKELILLKCPCYTKQFTDSVQSLSKFQ